MSITVGIKKNYQIKKVTPKTQRATPQKIQRPGERIQGEDGK